MKNIVWYFFERNDTTLVLQWSMLANQIKPLFIFFSQRKSLSLYLASVFNKEKS